MLDTMITTEQAEAVARASMPYASGLSDEDRRLVADLGNGALIDLARWVLHNAPVVRAAEAQADAEGDCLLQHVLQPNDAVGARHLYRAWERAAGATQAAVRAARAQEADHAR